MTKRTVKDWEVDGETKLLSTGDKGEGFRKAHAIVRPRDFTHRRVVGFAYRAEDARLFAAAGELLEAGVELVRLAAVASSTPADKLLAALPVATIQAAHDAMHAAIAKAKI